jgi:hypothetical protein
LLVSHLLYVSCAEGTAAADRADLLLEGRDFAIIDIGAFDSVSRCIAPSGGAVLLLLLLFVNGHPPSLLRESSAADLGVPGLRLLSLTAPATPQRMHLSVSGKAHRDYWSKAVINVSLES